MLRISDGKFTSDTIINIKSISGDTTNTSQIVGKQITQANNPNDININLTAGLIENFIAFADGSNTVYQLTLLKILYLVLLLLVRQLQCQQTVVLIQVSLIILLLVLIYRC